MYLVVTGAVEFPEKPTIRDLLIMTNYRTSYRRSMKRLNYAKAHVGISTKSLTCYFEIEAISGCGSSKPQQTFYLPSKFGLLDRKEVYSLAPIRIGIEIRGIEDAVIVHEITVYVVSFNNYRLALWFRACEMPFNKVELTKMILTERRNRQL
jgi:hypothetical protein